MVSLRDREGAPGSRGVPPRPRQGRSQQSVPEVGADRWPWRVVVVPGAAQDVADLFLGVAAVSTCALLELRLHVVVEVADENLRHRSLPRLIA